MKIIWTVLCLNILCCWAQSRIQEHHTTIKPAAVNQHNYASAGHINQAAKNLQNHLETNQPTTQRTDGARSLHFFSGTNHQSSLDVNHQPSRSYLPASNYHTSSVSPNQNFNQHNLNHLSSSPTHGIYQSNQQSSGYHSKTAFSENKYSQSKFSNTGVQQPTNIPSYIQPNRLDNPTPGTSFHNQLLSQQSVNVLNNPNDYFAQQTNSVTRNNYNTNGFNFQKNQYQVNQYQGGFSGSQSNQRGSATSHIPYTGFQTSHQPLGVNESSSSSEYQFSYGVAAQESGTEFEHQEARNGDQAKGKYSVLLPDGRRQLVEYEADEYGFRPKISYEGRSYSADPLSRDNVNTVVSDLLNTDLIRSRGQKASSAHQGRNNLGYQGGNSFGDVTTRYQQNQHFQTNRQVPPSLSNVYPTDSLQSPSGRSLNGFSTLNSNQISSNTFSTEPYRTSSRNIPNQINSPTTSFRSTSTSTHGSFNLRPQINYPSITTPLNQPTNGNQYNNYNPQPNTPNKLGLESRGRPRYVYAHSPGIIYSQSYANNRQDSTVLPQTINSS